MADTIQLPKYDDLFKPTLEAVAALGGSGSIEEIDDAVMTAIGAGADHLALTYPKSGAPVLPDRISWARSFLKLARLLANEKRGVWVLTEEGRLAARKSNAELKEIARKAYKASLAERRAASTIADNSASSSGNGEDLGWSDRLLQRVLAVAPDAFERLCQRLLRESGFTRVEITGKSGDGGIDGRGVLRVNLISFHVLFQCKRWKGSIGSEVIRNFRGAMQGRADKGLIITTGTFTVDARKESTRDGAPAIDLIDGEALCEMMKSLTLGVRVEEVRTEKVTVDDTFFGAL